MSERRKHFRRRVLLGGRLEIEKLNGWTADCTVRNLSEGGARIVLPAHTTVPPTLGLAISDRPRRPAKLVWVRDGHAGFELLDQRATEARHFSGSCRRSPAHDHSPRDLLAERIAAVIGKQAPMAHFTRP